MYYIRKELKNSLESKKIINTFYKSAKESIDFYSFGGDAPSLDLFVDEYYKIYDSYPLDLVSKPSLRLFLSRLVNMNSKGKNILYDNYCEKVISIVEDFIFDELLLLELNVGAILYSNLKQSSPSETVNQCSHTSRTYTSNNSTYNANSNQISFTSTTPSFHKPSNEQQTPTPKPTQDTRSTTPSQNITQKTQISSPVSPQDNQTQYRPAQVNSSPSEESNSDYSSLFKAACFVIILAFFFKACGSDKDDGPKRLECYVCGAPAKYEVEVEIPEDDRFGVGNSKTYRAYVCEKHRNSR